jgi:polyisoprenoid-binding protein YceI
MYNKKSLVYLTLLITPLFSAFRGPEVKGNENTAVARFVSSNSIPNEKYVIDKKESVVTWKGSMLLAGKGEHIGYVSISKGELMIEKNQLVGGTVEIDMSTITDKIHGSDNSLIDHLKDPDFFDVKKFPISTFAITKVAAGTDSTIEVTGDLTIKGITHAVTFPAKIEVKNGIVTANGKVIIDRTRWDVRYGSGKFYYNLADKAISDDIEFDMKIVAKK